jgi:serine incorporator 1/3
MFVLASLGGCLATSAASCACSCCAYATKEAMKRSARFAWSILFTFSLLLSWALRDFAKTFLKQIPCKLLVSQSTNLLTHSPFLSSTPTPHQLSLYLSYYTHIYTGIIKHGDLDHSDAWFGQQAVYRISMGNFLMFSTLAIITLGVRYRGDWRDKHLHHGSWPIKLLLWSAFNTLPFFFPNSLINAYSWLARLVSPLFLAIQLIIILDVTQSWNDSWVEEGADDERFLYALLALTVAAYAGCITMAGLMFHWFNPTIQGGEGGGDCSLNISLITIAILLCMAITFVSLHPAVSRGSIFPAASVSLYIIYLQFSAMQSEPREYACNGLGHQLNAASGTTLATGMVFTLLSVVYAAFRAGSNTQTFSMFGDEDDTYYGQTSCGGSNILEPLMPQNIAGLQVSSISGLTSAGLDGNNDINDATAPGSLSMDRATAVSGSSIGGNKRRKPGDGNAEEEDWKTIPYSYSQFYLVFALASAYIAMLMTGWGSGSEAKDLIDVGWVSVWVKVLSEWGIAGLFVWMLVAPLMFPDRDFS